MRLTDTLPTNLTQLKFLHERSIKREMFKDDEFFDEKKMREVREYKRNHIDRKEKKRKTHYIKKKINKSMSPILLKVVPS